MKYNHKKIEARWQKEWAKQGVFEAKDFDDQRKKYYALIEFPYPSGDGLHVGHPRPYIALDIIARKRRMEGYNVLYPMGWDAFGLPAENYAIKNKVHPAEAVKKNIKKFKEQVQSLGISFDWSREINTTDPAYYKWTQWIFLQLFKHGLAYKTKMPINWCLSCKIGLANEEVIDGKCERCGGETEKREKEQWMLKITKYADRLIEDLDKVDYLERIKTQQINWIGKSEGAELEFKIQNSMPTGRQAKFKIKVFTTRPDTLFGATYLVLAPEHPLLQNNELGVRNYGEVKKYIEKAKHRTQIERTALEKDKTGVELQGVKAINPATQEEIPIWVADYVLAEYGTGAVMAVPAHDERDFEFAKKFKLPIKVVVESCFSTTTGPDAIKKDLPIIEREAIMAIVKHWSADKYIGLKWKKVNWQTLITGGPEQGQTLVEGATTEIIEETGYLHPKLVKELGRVHSKFFHRPKKVNRFAHFHVLYFELQDGDREEVSKNDQDNHDVVWLSSQEMENFLSPSSQVFAWKTFQHGVQPFTGEGILTASGEFNGLDNEIAKWKIVEAVGGQKKVQYKLRDWVFSRQRYWGEPIPLVHCEKCDWIPVPEKDLPVELPKVKKYQPTDTGESPLAAVEDWVNTVCPKCGGPAKRETDTMPNWAGSSWYFLRYCDPHNDKEFADKKKLEYWMGGADSAHGGVNWYNGGMEHTTLHLLYSRFWYKFLYDIGMVPKQCGPEPYRKRTAHGMILGQGGEKMSKSKGNVVNPDEVVEKYGADTMRIYEMFMGPFEQAIAWSDESMQGARRFLEKTWREYQMTDGIIQIPPFVEGNKERALHKLIKKVTDDIELMKFNTAIATMMGFVGTSGLRREKKKDQVRVRDIFLRLLSPFAPHFAEELYEQLKSCYGLRVTGYVSQQEWPKYDPELAKDEEIELVIQINGKVRDTIKVNADIEESEAQELALKGEKINKWLAGQKIKKVVFVKGKLINIVI